MSNGTFDFNKFLKESTDVLVNPKSYFSSMKTTGGMTEPLIKAVIYGAIAGAIAFLWSMLNLSSVNSGIFGSAFGIMILISQIIGSIIGLFIGAVIILVISSICKGNTDFEANLRVTAAIMVVIPINAFLGFSGHFNIYLGVILSMAVYIFALWLLYNGLIGALRSNQETAKIVSYVLIAILVIIMLTGFITARKTNQILKEFNNTDFKEQQKDFPKH